ncbi:Transmembrane protein 241 [Collichthys lucidus]|uniref:Transmembrane protein 241 n=1 Tax=Collichthys lucidus TaxID=240159 RepID=A0A4U5VJF6_COLLU|nr:Transmembrane protein 241 [Collichthys lucidus]TKS87951.1 Transmembrane protein 241 [Collichthys lucidus]
MQWRRHIAGLAFSFIFVVSYFTNKFVLSVLKFTYPTLFQGWQTFIGAVLLLLSGKLGWVEMSRITSLCLMLISAVNLPHYDPQFDQSGYLWAVGHLFCVGAYRVFQVRYKPSNLSVLLLAIAAHPTGDLMGAMEFPSLQSYTFHCGCCASALLGFLLLLATVRLKSGFSLEHFGIWFFMSKVTAMCLSPFIFNMDFNVQAFICVVGSHVGEALLVYSERE